MFWNASECSLTLVACWQIMYHIPTIPNSSCLCHVIQCLLIYFRTIVITDPACMWLSMGSSSIELYILAMCYRYTSLESHLSFQNYPIAWRVIASEWFPYRYHGGYLLIYLISWPSLIALRRDWYWSKGLFKGFWEPLRPWELLKNWWRYDWMKFVTHSGCSYTIILHIVVPLCLI